MRAMLVGVTVPHVIGPDCKHEFVMANFATVSMSFT